MDKLNRRSFIWAFDTDNFGSSCRLMTMSSGAHYTVVVTAKLSSQPVRYCCRSPGNPPCGWQPNTIPRTVAQAAATTKTMWERMKNRLQFLMSSLLEVTRSTMPKWMVSGRNIDFRWSKQQRTAGRHALQKRPTDTHHNFGQQHIHVAHAGRTPILLTANL